MRIVGGSLRGSKLADIGTGDAAAHLRPTTDRVREAVFNLIAHGGYASPPLPMGVHVLDLFAGSGALGFEALSRGAVSVAFVDDGKVAARLIRENTRALNRGDQTRHLKVNASSLGANSGPAAGLVFLDPPYGKSLGRAALVAALAGGWIAPGALVIWEDSVENPAPPGFTISDMRRYGSTAITILTASAP